MYQNGENPGNTPKAVTSSDIKATVAAGKEPSVKTSSVKAAADNEYFEDYVAPEWVEYESGTALYDYIMSQSEPVEVRVNLDYVANTEAGLTLFEIVQEVLVLYCFV